MSAFRSFRQDALPPVVKYLIIVNVAVYIAQLTLDRLVGITNKIMLYPIQAPSFQAYQVITHMFAHSPDNLFHIVFNMFGLWMFGSILEKVWGNKRFLNFYLICGIGAAFLHLLVQYITWEHLQQAINEHNFERAKVLRASLAPALGASGAIMGILAAFGFLFPNVELYFMLLIPIKAKWAVIGMALFDLFGGIAGKDNVAHFAHLGGAITGFILVFFWNKTNRKKFY